MVDNLQERIERLEKNDALLRKYVVEGFWRIVDVVYDHRSRDRGLECIICGHSDRIDAWEMLTHQCVFGGGRLDRYRCPKCECIFGPMKYLEFDDSFITKDYKILYMDYSEGDTTFNEIRTFRSLSPNPHLVYLNWGCGEQNSTIRTLRDEGFIVWGYEPSAETEIPYVVNQRTDVAPGFDAIFSNNVIEHFRDPVAQFRDFHALLKDGGTMAHSSPCYEYDFAFTRFHTIFLTGKSPYVLAERTGFEVANVIQDGQYINYVFRRL